jgi:cysteine desulfurase
MKFPWTKETIYLDHAAATPPDQDLVRCAAAESIEYFHNPGGIHDGAVAAQRHLDSARTIAAKLLGTQSDRIIFGRGGTECCNMATSGVARALYQQLARPISILINPLEHPATLEPLLKLAAQGIVQIAEIPIDATGTVVVSELRTLMNAERPDMVVCQYVNSETGVVQPIVEIGRLILSANKNNEHQIYFICDAIQAFNYQEMNVQKLHVDVLIISGSKIYGPRSCALLYTSRNLPIIPLLAGGGQESGMRPGTTDPAQAMFLARAMERAAQKRDTEVARLAMLQSNTIDQLNKEFPDIVINSNAAVISPNIINISIPKCDSEYIVLALQKAGFAVSSQSACSARSGSRSRIIKRLWQLADRTGDDYADVRISMGRNTRPGDISNCITSLRQIATKYTSWNS